MPKALSSSRSLTLFAQSMPIRMVRHAKHHMKNVLKVNVKVNVLKLVPLVHVVHSSYPRPAAGPGIRPP